MKTDIQILTKLPIIESPIKKDVNVKNNPNNKREFA